MTGAGIGAKDLIFLVEAGTCTGTCTGAGTGAGTGDGTEAGTEAGTGAKDLTFFPAGTGAIVLIFLAGVGAEAGAEAGAGVGAETGAETGTGSGAGATRHMSAGGRLGRGHGRDGGLRAATNLP